MDTDFSCEAAHARRMRFRRAMICGLVAIIVELAIVAGCAILVARRTPGPSPIDTCVSRYGLSVQQCRDVEFGTTIPVQRN